MRRLVLACALLLSAVLAVAGSAAAHPATIASAMVPAAPIASPSLHETLSAAPAAPGAPVAALALLAGVALAAVSRRRTVAVTLALVVALFAFETGLHSTHHLGTAEDASHCLVAWMSAQISADVPDVVLTVQLAVAPPSPVLVPATPVVVTRVIAPDAGRAPPALSS